MCMLLDLYPKNYYINGSLSSKKIKILSEIKNRISKNLSTVSSHRFKWTYS